MSKSRLMYVGLLATMIAAPAFAQSGTPVTPGTTNAADQTQIEQGLQNGSLSAGEAAKLEHGQQRLDKEEATGASQTNLQNQQNGFENRVNKLESNSVTGNPNSVNNQRMQRDVQRNINQQNRIGNGVSSGQLTPQETQHMENGQAHVNRAEARSHGVMTNAHQASIQSKENRHSRQIHHKKHNGNTTAPTTESTPPASN